MKFTQSRRIFAALCLVGLASASGAADVFAPGSQPTGWVTKPSSSNLNVSSGTEAIYRADYQQPDWSGNVYALDINASGVVQTTSPWNPATAAEKIDKQDFNSISGRKIVTVKGDGSKVSFQWANLDATQQASLGDAITGPAILNFVRGERTNEAPLGSNYHKRANVLGDIIHSSTLYWNNGTAKRLYVGANDGMLHALDAATGSEVFAYIPSMVVANLNKLTANPYTHTYFVDGPMSMANVLIGASTQTILVGGLGAGGKGLYALDVTVSAPADEAAAAAMIKWEISPATAGFANLGYTYAMPRLARLNNGTAVVIVGNGYMSSGGKAVLYVIDADKGTIIKEIDTGSGTALSPNGLSSPTLVDSNNDGKVDFVYAGDLDGKVWKFDMTSNTVASFFTTAPAQAITVAPVVYPHPNSGHMIMFGTGRMLTSADATSAAVHRVYGIWDGAPPANVTANKLVAQSLTEIASITPPGKRLRYATKVAPNWAIGGDRGWATTLPAGERVLGDAPFINNSRYYFASVNPTITNASPPNGENWMTELDFLSGGSPSQSFIDLNGNGSIDAGDLVSGQIIVGTYMGVGVISQPMLLDLGSFSTTLFNSNPDYAVVIPNPTDRGLSKGHFDVDTYYGVTCAASTPPCISKTHVHEYDDKYNVTGVNFLAPSDPAFDLNLAIPAGSTQFKILVMNQYINPALTLKIGNKTHESVKTYGNLASQTDAATLLAALPTYKKNISSLEFNLPLDAFTAKDWWGDGLSPRAGLMPTQTDCVKEGPTAEFQPGPNGENHNGALTIQFIKSTTPATALQLNVAGQVKYGWQVAMADYATYVLAEYTVFWHHPNGLCYGDASWIQNPPPDLTPSDPLDILVLAKGSKDPGSMMGGFTSTVAITSDVTKTSGMMTAQTVTYADGTTYKRETMHNADGTDTVTEWFPLDPIPKITIVPAKNGANRPGPNERSSPTGRSAWREITR